MVWMVEVTVRFYTPYQQGRYSPATTMKHFILAMTLSGLLLIVGCTSSTSSRSSDTSEGDKAAPKCTEPENPYSEGTGHYAGYEWAENKGSGACGGSSQSFIEGCEEYERQETEYQECEAQKKN
jgi:hypothetical protein